MTSVATNPVEPATMIFMVSTTSTRSAGVADSREKGLWEGAGRCKFKEAD
jgi:hypothetical protein